MKNRTLARSKFVRFGAVISVSALVLSMSNFGWAGASSTKQRNYVHTIIFYNINGATNPNTLAVNLLAKTLKKESKNTLLIRTVNASVGSDSSAIDDLREGTIDMGLFDADNLSSLKPEIGAFDLPFLINNTADANAAYGPKGPFLKLVAPFLSKKYDMNIMGFYQLGWSDYIGSKPVTTLSNFTGLTLRVQADGIQPQALSAVGGVAVPLAFADIPTALQTGTVDGFFDPVQIIDAGSYDSIVKNMTILNMLYNTNAIVIQKNFFNSLSPDQQKILTSAVAYTAKWELAKNTSVYNTDITQLESQGVTVSNLSPSDIAQWKTDLAPLYQQWESEYPAVVKQLMSLPS